MWNLWFYNSAGEWEYAGHYTQHQAFLGSLEALKQYIRASTFTPGAVLTSDESELGQQSQQRFEIGLSLWKADEEHVND